MTVKGYNDLFNKKIKYEECDLFDIAIKFYSKTQAIQALESIYEERDLIYDSGYMVYPDYWVVFRADGTSVITLDYSGNSKIEIEYSKIENNFRQVFRSFKKEKFNDYAIWHEKFMPKSKLKLLDSLIGTVRGNGIYGVVSKYDIEGKVFYAKSVRRDQGYFEIFDCETEKFVTLVESSDVDWKVTEEINKGLKL